MKNTDHRNDIDIADEILQMLFCLGVREQGLDQIRLQAIYSGLSKSNFKDHYGEAVKEQCLDMIAEIDEFLVYDEML